MKDRDYQLIWEAYLTEQPVAGDRQAAADKRLADWQAAANAKSAEKEQGREAERQAVQQQHQVDMDQASSGMTPEQRLAAGIDTPTAATPHAAAAQQTVANSADVMAQFDKNIADREAASQQQEDDFTARMQASTDAAMQQLQQPAAQPNAQGIVERPETEVNPEYIKHMIDKVGSSGKIPNFHGTERTKFTEEEKKIVQMIQTGMQGAQPTSAQPAPVA